MIFHLSTGIIPGTLTVSDILRTGILPEDCSGVLPVDAGKFVGNRPSYTIADPNVYAIPLGCIIPVNLDNVLMPVQRHPSDP